MDARLQDCPLSAHDACRRAPTRQLRVWTFIGALGLLSACTSPGARNVRDLSGRPINVVTTTGMIADLVRHVGADRVRVTALMGPGVDPHQYKASERDVSRLTDADIIFYNGLHLEGAMARVLDRLQPQGTTAAVGEGVPDSMLLSPPAFSGAHDPHIWFDVHLWIDALGVVEHKLAGLDSLHAEHYHANARAYRERLRRLHEYVAAEAQRIPLPQRVLVTAHDAFNYFGRAYGIDVRGLQGISTATEAGTADIQELARFIAERRIPAIFVESSVPRRSIEALQAAVQSRGFNVQIGGQLYSDALGAPGTPEGEYIGMVTANITTIVNALSRSPEGPAGDARAQD